MGKKSKANRKKASVATLSATTTATAAASAVVAAAATITTETKRGQFPVSAFFMKGASFFKKGNYAKAQKIFLQGLEHGCVRCLYECTMDILVGKATIENMDIKELCNNNRNLHLVLPLALEGAIRGNHDAIVTVCGAYAEVQHEKKDSNRFGDIRPATPLILYWSKWGIKNLGREDRPQMKQFSEELKEGLGTQCSVCEKQDSETVTLRKCDGCKFYYYCSTECQKLQWHAGHAGVCRHLGVLQKYHKPFAKKIWKDIVVHGIAPKDIPELQDLRQRLGLSRPQADYQESLDAAEAGYLDPVQLILPCKDGTVQIGSFPRPI